MVSHQPRGESISGFGYISNRSRPMGTKYGRRGDGKQMRNRIEIVQIRVTDIEPGDVVNKKGPEKAGWIEVDRIETLPSGDLVIHDVNDRDSFTTIGYNLVWLQTVLRLKANSHLALDG